MTNIRMIDGWWRICEGGEPSTKRKYVYATECQQDCDKLNFNEITVDELNKGDVMDYSS